MQPFKPAIKKPSPFFASTQSSHFYSPFQQVPRSLGNVVETAQHAANNIERQLMDFSIFSMPTYANLEELHRKLKCLENYVVDPLRKLHMWSLHGPMDTSRCTQQYILDLNETIQSCYEMMNVWRDFIFVHNVGINTLKERLNTYESRNSTESTNGNTTESDTASV